MRLTVRLFGLDLLDVELSTETPAEDDVERDLSGGTTASMPMGFTASPGDQRWEFHKAPEFE